MLPSDPGREAGLWKVFLLRSNYSIHLLKSIYFDVVWLGLCNSRNLLAEPSWEENTQSAHSSQRTGLASSERRCDPSVVSLAFGTHLCVLMGRGGSFQVLSLTPGGNSSSPGAPSGSTLGVKQQGRGLTLPACSALPTPGAAHVGSHPFCSRDTASRGCQASQA